MNDPRIAELEQIVNEDGVALPMPVSLILWFENHGCVVDLITGQVNRPADWVDVDTARGAYYTQLTSSLP